MKNLVVTLADENYIDQVKQLFSSIYWNAGWNGDYMLLSHKIPEGELKWFRDKGVLINECEPISKKSDTARIWPACFLSKFYLFTPVFKKWKNIVYLDADITVMASLDELTKIKGFAAVPDIRTSRLVNQFTGPKDEKCERIINELKKRYNLKESAFNAGVMAFSTDIIENGSFSRLEELYKTYHEISYYGDQNSFNLLFYKRWIKLPLVYNLFPYYVTKDCNIKPEKIKAIILHFTGVKPWDSRDYFYKEWKSNLEKADSMDLKKTQIPKIWIGREIKKYSFYFKRKYMIFRLDRYIGLIGLFLKNNFPKFYRKLKRLKNEE